MFRREPVAWVALFLALTGTAVAARPLVTGADVRDGAVRSVDVKNGSLERVDARPSVGRRGSRGPQGLAGLPGPTGAAGPPSDGHLTSAVINADGTVRHAVDAPTVSHPAPGVYCVQAPDARWLTAQSTNTLSPQTVAADVGADDACAAPATVSVRVRTGPALADGPFLVLIDTIA